MSTITTVSDLPWNLPSATRPKRPTLGGLARFLVDFDDRKANVEFGADSREAGYAPGWMLLPIPLLTVLVAWAVVHLS